MGGGGIPLEESSPGRQTRLEESQRLGGRRGLRGHAEVVAAIS